jgi:hypothetical protein
MADGCLICPDTYTHSFAMSGTGAAFITSSALLADAKPSQVTRCRWISGTQTTSSFTRITVSLVNPAGGTPVIGAVIVKGISGLPLGLKVVFNGDTTHQVNLALCPSGGLEAIYVPAATFSASSFTIDFYNNVSGATAVAASALFDVGEIMAALRWVSPFGMQTGWKPQWVDPSIQKNMGDNSNGKVARVPYRTLSIALSAVDWDNAYGTPSSGQMNLQALGKTLAKSSRCLVMPRWQLTGAIDQTVINAVALFGGVVPNGIGALENDKGVWFKQTYQFREYPHGD